MKQTTQARAPDCQRRRRGVGQVRLQSALLADTRLLLVAACALVDADGRVLVARRPEGKTMAGLWEFPGGKVEAGEAPEDTLIRELREELGIENKRGVPGAVNFCQPSLSGFSPCDAALRMPPLARHAARRRGAGPEVGPGA